MSECPACKNQVSATASFCAKCGHRFGKRAPSRKRRGPARQEGTPPAPEPPQVKSDTPPVPAPPVPAPPAPAPPAPAPPVQAEPPDTVPVLKEVEPMPATPTAAPEEETEDATALLTDMTPEKIAALTQAASDRYQENPKPPASSSSGRSINESTRAIPSNDGTGGSVPSEADIPTPIFLTGPPPVQTAPPSLNEAEEEPEQDEEKTIMEMPAFLQETHEEEAERTRLQPTVPSPQSVSSPVAFGKERRSTPGRSTPVKTARTTETLPSLEVGGNMESMVAAWAKLAPSTRRKAMVGMGIAVICGIILLLAALFSSSVPRGPRNTAEPVPATPETAPIAPAVEKIEVPSLPVEKAEEPDKTKEDTPQEAPEPEVSYMGDWSLDIEALLNSEEFAGFSKAEKGLAHSMMSKKGNRTAMQIEEERLIWQETGQTYYFKIESHEGGPEDFSLTIRSKRGKIRKLTGKMKEGELTILDPIEGQHTKHFRRPEAP